MRLQRIFIFGFCLLSLAWHSHARESIALNNVSYQSVLELDYQPAQQVLNYGPSALQFIEGWLPASDNRIADIVFIHGGCWLNAYDIAHSRPFTSALRDAGFRVWSIEYRRTGDEGGGWPETFYDIENAVQYLMNADLIELENTLLLGHSAGGHLGLLAAQKNTDLKGVIGLAAIADLNTYATGDNGCQQVTEQFMEGMPQDNPEAYKSANPKFHPMHINTHLIYSTDDAIVPVDQVNGLKGIQPVKVTGVGHFDFIHPGTTVWPTIIDTLKQALQNEH